MTEIRQSADDLARLVIPTLHDDEARRLLQNVSSSQEILLRQVPASELIDIYELRLTRLTGSRRSDVEALLTGLSLCRDENVWAGNLALEPPKLLYVWFNLSLDQVVGRLIVTDRRLTNK